MKTTIEGVDYDVLRSLVRRAWLKMVSLQSGNPYAVLPEFEGLLYELEKIFPTCLSCGGAVENRGELCFECAGKKAMGEELNLE